MEKRSTTPKLSAAAIEEFIKKVRPEDEPNVLNEVFTQGATVSNNNTNGGTQIGSTIPDGTDDGQMLYWDTNAWVATDIADLKYEIGTKNLLSKTILPQASGLYTLGDGSHGYKSLYLIGTAGSPSIDFLYNERSGTVNQTLGSWTDGRLSVYKNAVVSGGAATALRMTCNVNYMFLAADGAGNELRPTDCAPTVNAIEISETNGGDVKQNIAATEAFQEIDYLNTSGTFVKKYDRNCTGASRDNYNGTAIPTSGGLGGFADGTAVTFTDNLPDTNYTVELTGYGFVIPSSVGGQSYWVNCIPCIVAGTKAVNGFSISIIYHFYDYNTNAWRGSWNKWTAIPLPLQTTPVDMRVLANTGLDVVDWEVRRHF